MCGNTGLPVEMYNGLEVRMNTGSDCVRIGETEAGTTSDVLVALAKLSCHVRNDGQDCEAARGEGLKVREIDRDTARRMSGTITVTTIRGVRQFVADPDGDQLDLTLAISVLFTKSSESRIFYKRSDDDVNTPWSMSGVLHLPCAKDSGRRLAVQNRLFSLVPYAG